MNHAVLLYKDTPNIEGVPGDWPCETYPLGDSTELPKDGRNFILMTDQELQDHFAAHAAEKEAWNEENHDVDEQINLDFVQTEAADLVSGKIESGKSEEAAVDMSSLTPADIFRLGLKYGKDDDVSKINLVLTALDVTAKAADINPVDIKPATP